jgi:hypothetical protein
MKGKMCMLEGTITERASNSVKTPDMGKSCANFLLSATRGQALGGQKND